MASRSPASSGRTGSTYAGRACERCRARKQRCSGEAPSCASCISAKKECHYTEAVDRRTLARAWKRENAQLQQRVAELERALRSFSSTSRSSISSSRPHSPESPSEHYTATWLTRKARRGSGSGDEEDEETTDSSNEPFGTGALVLSPDGNLHLGAEATFYRPGLFSHPKSYVAAEALIDLGGSTQSSSAHLHSTLGRSISDPSTWSGNDLVVDSDAQSYTSLESSIPPHKAPYIPCSLDKSFHQHLLDLFFAYTPPFGMNTFKAQFFQSMRSNPMEKQLYYSPFLHLVCLGIGSRYNTAGRSAGDYPSSQDYLQRGEIFIDRARAMADSETESPTLGTIIGLVYLSIYCFGMMKDQAATNYYAIAVFLVQEFRLHRKCDDQLRSAGTVPHGELDVARRDVYGFMLNYSSWWMNYFARLSLNFFAEANQRLPSLRRDEEGNIDVISTAFRHHCLLSESGHKIVFCNHALRTNFTKRSSLAKQLSADLLAWRQNLPDSLQWPQRNAASMMIPGVAVLLIMYNAYVIELHRPYINFSGDPALWPNAMDFCVQATEEMIDIIRYIRDYHGVHSAPLTTQQAIYVSGTMLVLLASGLGDRPEEVVLQARRNLLYLLRWLDEFSEIWPAAAQTAESLRILEKEHCF